MSYRETLEEREDRYERIIAKVRERELPAQTGSPPITAEDFESGCNNVITGWLWDESYSLDYQESVTLSIREMRHIANVLRAAEGLPLHYSQEWSENAANEEAEE